MFILTLNLKPYKNNFQILSSHILKWAHTLANDTSHISNYSLRVEVKNKKDNTYFLSPSLSHVLLLFLYNDFKIIFPMIS